MKNYRLRKRKTERLRETERLSETERERDRKKREGGEQIGRIKEKKIKN